MNNPDHTEDKEKKASMPKNEVEKTLAKMSANQKDVEVSPVTPPKINKKVASEGKGLEIDFIKTIPVTVTAELGHVYMSIEKVLSLAPGSLIHLQRELDEPIDILINDKLVAKGEIVTVENRFGVRITQVIDASIYKGVN